MRVTTTKSKNSESFYITHSYTKNDGTTTSRIYKKLGTLASLERELNTDRDGVMEWAKEQARIETEKYKKEKEAQTVLIPFHADRELEYDKQVFYEGGYLFLQSIYYQLRLDRICTKIRRKYDFKYDLNAILSDLIYTRVLEPSSKRSSYAAAGKFLEAPSYGLHDVYRALTVLGENSDLIQSEVYKNSHFLLNRNDKVLYYDCTNYYFETEQEEGDKKYGKSKEHRPNPIIQMGLFVDGDGIPLAYSLFPGNQNEQKSLKPLEQKILKDFGHQKFIYCSDAGLASEANKEFNHNGERAFIVTQSIKKLKKDEKEWALSKTGFRRVSDNKPVDIENLSDEDMNGLFYKEEPYSTARLHQRMIVTYSPKYAVYQKSIRGAQVERAEAMMKSGKLKKDRQNPNDPARFVGKLAVTKEGEKADIQYYLDKDKIQNEARFDGLYAVCTDLLDDPVADILKVSEGRWQIEACFRVLKTDFSARPVYASLQQHIQAHFLVCFLALLVFRILENKLDYNFTCEQIIHKLQEMNFADIQEQGFMPLYTKDSLSDALHDISNFRTDFQFITKAKMKTIQKQSKGN